MQDRRVVFVNKQPATFSEADHMKSTTLHNFNTLKARLDDIYEVEPNNLEFYPVSWLYRAMTRPVKKMPFIFIIPISIVMAVCLYLLFGQLVIKLVTLLQNGF